MRVLQAHANPSLVLRAPLRTLLVGAFFEDSVSDFAVDLRLLVGGEVILRDVCVEILKAGGLAESDELIMNEAVSEGV